MSGRRRAVLLGGLSILLGALAASHVARREAELQRRLGPAVPVVVARDGLAAGDRLTPRRLAVRSVPGRYAPAGAFPDPAALAGLRAAVDLPAGADVVAGVVRDGAEPVRPGPPVRPGERVADVVATGSAELVRPGARVDVLVTRGGDGAPGHTELALEDVEVLASSPAPGDAADAGAPRVAASLRVTVRQAVFLAAAQSFARDIRLLPRAPGDDRRGATGLSVGSGLG